MISSVLICLGIVAFFLLEMYILRKYCSTISQRVPEHGQAPTASVPISSSDAKPIMDGINRVWSSFDDAMREVDRVFENTKSHPSYRKTTVSVDSRVERRVGKIEPGTTLDDEQVVIVACNSCSQKNKLKLKDQKGRRCGRCGLPLAIGRKI